MRKGTIPPLYALEVCFHSREKTKNTFVYNKGPTFS